MNYDKYKTEHVDAERSALGGLLSESTIAKAKKYAKSAAGYAVSGASHALEAAKVVTPGIGHAVAAGAHVGLAVRDGVSLGKTEAHIMVLKEIQGDLTKNTSLCSCDHCPEVVGYAIAQKNKKLERKKTAVKADLTSAASPVPMPIGAVVGAAGLAHTAQKEKAGTRGVERNRQASLVHLGARGVRFVQQDGGTTFVGGCAVARAIIDELTGHWQRCVYADDGPTLIALKLSSKN